MGKRHSLSRSSNIPCACRWIYPSFFLSFFFRVCFCVFSFESFHFQFIAPLLVHFFIFFVSFNFVCFLLCIHFRREKKKPKQSAFINPSKNHDALCLLNVQNMHIPCAQLMNLDCNVLARGKSCPHPSHTHLCFISMKKKSHPCQLKQCNTQKLCFF